MVRWTGLVAIAAGWVAGCDVAPDTTPVPTEDPVVTWTEIPLELVAADAPFALEASATFYADLAYGPDERQVFDLFVPDGPGPFPLVMEVHGGGFTGGDKGDFYLSDAGPTQIEDVLAAGAAFANVEYRLITQPDDQGVIKPLGDVRKGLQYLRYHSAEIGLDPTRIVGRGTSAGAGTVMWLAVHDDMADPEAGDPVLRESTRLLGAYSFETQASYDLVRWETDVFAPYGITLAIAADLGVEDLLLSFYAMDQLDDLYEEPVISYRAEVDMVGLMSVDDPPLRIENIYEPNGFPAGLGALYHHPRHALVASEAGKAAGIDVQAVIPMMDIDDSDGETATEWILRQLF